MKNRSSFLIAIIAMALFLSGPVFSETGGVGSSPAAPGRAAPAPAKPAPVTAPVAAPAGVKVPVCGNDAPDLSQPQRSAGVTDATTLKVSHSIGAVGDTIVLKAKLTRNKDGAAVGNHSVNFTVAGQPAGSEKTDLQGEARVQYKVPAQMGSRAIGARYRGSALCSPSTGQDDLGVVKSATKISLIRENESITLHEGQEDTLHGKLFRITDNEGLDGRAVSLLLDGKPLGSVASNPSGKFSKQFIIPPPSAGAHTFEARFEGDPLYLGSTGKYTYQVLPKIKNAYLTWTGASGKVGQTVTVTARLGLGNPPTSATAIPGKTISFWMNGPKVFGTAVTNGQGVATLSFKIEDPAGNYWMAAEAQVSKYTEYKVTNLSEPKYKVEKAPVAVSASGPGSAAIGSKVTFTATVRRTTDNGPAAGVSVKMTLDPAAIVGMTAITNGSGQAIFQYQVPFAYGTGAKTLTFASSESSHYLGGSGKLAFSITPKTN